MALILNVTWRVKFIYVSLGRLILWNSPIALKEKLCLDQLQNTLILSPKILTHSMYQLKSPAFHINIYIKYKYESRFNSVQLTLP